MFSCSYNFTDKGGLTFIQWPDCKPYLEQCSFTFVMFFIIRKAFLNHKQREADKMKRKAKGRK